MFAANLCHDSFHAQQAIEYGTLLSTSKLRHMS